MYSWQDVHVGIEGDDFQISGLEVWRQKWRKVDIAPIHLPHPSYPTQMHWYDVYDIGDAEQSARFAAGELSANVWGFYIPK